MGLDHSHKQTRQGAKFVTAKKKKWRENLLASVKKRRRAEKEPSKVTTVGRRIVEVETLAENLWCHRCDLRLSLKNISSEMRYGLASIFMVKCLSCNAYYSVKTGKSSSKTSKNRPLSDVNLGASFGECCVYSTWIFFVD